MLARIQRYDEDGGIDPIVGDPPIYFGASEDDRRQLDALVGKELRRGRPQRQEANADRHRHTGT
jgi:hypothetical protein